MPGTAHRVADDDPLRATVPRNGCTFRADGEPFGPDSREQDRLAVHLARDAPPSGTWRDPDALAKIGTGWLFGIGGHSSIGIPTMEPCVNRRRFSVSRRLAHRFPVKERPCRTRVPSVFPSSLAPPKGRMSAHAARFVHGQLRKRDGVDPELIDVGALMHRFDENGEGTGDPAVRREHGPGRRHRAVAPEYNHAMPGLLKHVLDSCLKEYIHKAGASSRCPRDRSAGPG